jgi:hypothetical protein
MRARIYVVGQDGNVVKVGVDAKVLALDAN